MKNTSVRSVVPRTLVSVFVALATTHALADSAALDSSDKSFIQNAYEDGLAEVKMAEMAQGKTANPDVKSFAEKMATDHSKADSELKTVADSKKITVATEPTLTAQGKAKLLEARSGASFDKDYAKDMVSAHKKAIETFERAAHEAKDPEVKELATKLLPTLREHLSMAEALETKLGK
jgi:putative membrane protein